MKPTFWGDEACSGPLSIFGFPGPFVASRFDPDACDLTSEQQDVYDPAASSFVLTEGVCTNLCKLPTAITISDERLPDENLPHSYKFTCTNNCEGQLACLRRAARASEATARWETSPAIMVPASTSSA